MPGVRIEIPKEETNKIRRSGEKNRNWGNWKTGTFVRMPFSGTPEVEALREGRFAYKIKINKERISTKERGVYWRKPEIRRAIVFKKDHKSL